MNKEKHGLMHMNWIHIGTDRNSAYATTELDITHEYSRESKDKQKGLDKPKMFETF